MVNLHKVVKIIYIVVVVGILITMHARKTEVVIVEHASDFGSDCGERAENASSESTSRRARI